MLHLNDCRQRGPCNDRSIDRCPGRARMPISVVLCWVFSLIAVDVRAAFVEVPIRVVFQFTDDLAKSQYPDEAIPLEEAKLSEKLAQACKAKLPYWTFVPATPKDVIEKHASQTEPVLNIWLEHSTDMRVVMQLSGPTPMPDDRWSAT